MELKGNVMRMWGITWLCNKSRTDSSIQLAVVGLKENECARTGINISLHRLICSVVKACEFNFCKLDMLLLPFTLQLCVDFFRCFWQDGLMIGRPKGKSVEWWMGIANML